MFEHVKISLNSKVGSGRSFFLYDCFPKFGSGMHSLSSVHQPAVGNSTSYQRSEGFHIVDIGEASST